VCFRQIRYGTKVGAKLAVLVLLTHMFGKRNCVRLFRNERTRSTPLDPKVMLWMILEHFVTARKLVQKASNWCHERASLQNEVASEFFSTNAPDPLHWTQKSCSGSFRTISLQYQSRCKTGQTGDINGQVC
jgi:hypothetical protein